MSNQILLFVNVCAERPSMSGGSSNDIQVFSNLSHFSGLLTSQKATLSFADATRDVLHRRDELMETGWTVDITVEELDDFHIGWLKECGAL